MPSLPFRIKLHWLVSIPINYLRSFRTTINFADPKSVSNSVCGFVYDSFRVASNYLSRCFLFPSAEGSFWFRNWAAFRSSELLFRPHTSGKYQGRRAIGGSTPPFWSFCSLIFVSITYWLRVVIYQIIGRCWVYPGVIFCVLQLLLCKYTIISYNFCNVQQYNIFPPIKTSLI